MHTRSRSRTHTHTHTGEQWRNWGWDSEDKQGRSGKQERPRALRDIALPNAPIPLQVRGQPGCVQRADGFGQVTKGG
jgi:hypothetical protein